MDSVADTEALAEDAPLLHRAAETLAVATRSLRRPAGSMAAVAETGNSTAVADITVAGDIMARVLDSVSAVTRHTDMPLRYVIPPDSTTSTATGNTIPVARFRTDTRFDGCATLPEMLWPPLLLLSEYSPILPSLSEARYLER